MAERPKLPLSSRAALVGSVAFTLIRARETVPLANACGLYVDWYRPG
jgi:hypothetical protein